MSQLMVLLCSRYENATPNLCWVSCAIHKGGFFEIAFSSSTHICLALRRLLTFCLTLTRQLVVILVSSALIFQRFAVFEKRSSFKKFAESS